tara:strand:- start:236 stop:391 length:156 start_codon:yes stop_codon:yes gene_type:complete
MDTLIRGAVAPAGFFACVELQSINGFVSFIVGVATIVFLGLSIYKLIKEIK